MADQKNPPAPTGLPAHWQAVHDYFTNLPADANHDDLPELPELTDNPATITATAVRKPAAQS